MRRGESGWGIPAWRVRSPSITFLSWLRFTEDWVTKAPGFCPIVSVTWWLALRSFDFAQYVWFRDYFPTEKEETNPLVWVFMSVGSLISQYKLIHWHFIYRTFFHVFKECFVHLVPNYTWSSEQNQMIKTCGIVNEFSPACHKY